MNVNDITNAIILILKNIDFSNSEIAERQICSCRDLIDTIIIDLSQNKICEHPQENRVNFSTLGDKQKTERCSICGETIISDWRED